MGFLFYLGLLPCDEEAQHILIAFMETILLITTRNKIIITPNQRSTVAQLIERYTRDRRVGVVFDCIDS